jgi:hypothetical protein
VEDVDWQFQSLVDLGVRKPELEVSQRNASEDSCKALPVNLAESDPITEPGSTVEVHVKIGEQILKVLEHHCEFLPHFRLEPAIKSHLMKQFDVQDFIVGPDASEVVSVESRTEELSKLGGKD